MKIYALQHLPWQIVLCQVLSHITIHFVNEADAKLGHVGWAKSDSRTRQILQNIRSHIAQQEDIQQQKECDPGVSPCKIGKTKQSDEDDSVEHATRAPEIIPPFRFRTRHKTAAQLKKDVAQAVTAKDQKTLAKRKQKEEENDSSETEGKSLRKIKEDDKEDKVRIKREAKQGKKVKESEEELEAKLERPKPKERPKDRDEQQKTKLGKTVQPTEEKKQAKSALKKPVTVPEPKKEKKNLRKPEPIEEKHEKPKRKPKDDVRFPEDIPVFSLASDSVKSEQCKEHSRVYLRQLKRYKLWALMMYDSTAKLPSGILQGNSNQYGDFDQCISVNATFRKPSRDGISGIEGKYCLATVDVSSESFDPGLQHAIHRSRSFDFVKSKISDPGHFIPRFSTINWGLCIPSVCKAEDVENSIKSSLDTYKKSSGLTFEVKVEDKNCVTKKDLLSDYDIKTYITLLFYAGVIGVAIYATLRDTSARKCKSVMRSFQTENGHEELEDGAVHEAISTNFQDEERDITSRHGKLKALVMAFSLKRNVNKLFIEGESGDNIDCIHGIKSIFTVMLYFAHKTIPLALTPFSNRVVFTEISNESSSVLLRGSIIYTDSFLLLSGVLVSFNLGKEIKRHGRILWIRRIIARIIRLTPALLATLLFYAYISSYLGSGPMWNVVVSENSRLCRQHMWRNLFYIQNFYPFEEMCAPQTHQLALDMQLFLLSPLLVYFLYEYDKVGIGILQAFLMVSSILRFTSTANNELSLFIFHGMSISQLYNTANLLYTQTVHRATPYIIGVLIGYYLQKVGKEFKLPNLLVIFGWILSSCLAVSSLITQAHLTKQEYEYSSSEAAHYAALSPIAWSAAIGWFITACYLGYGGKLNTYLCSKGFVILSRISYSVYLTQFLVFSHTVGSKRIPENFSVYDSINLTEIAIVLAISIAMTLLFDIPTVEIKKIILDSFPSKKESDFAVPTETAQEKEDVRLVESEQQSALAEDVMEESSRIENKTKDLREEMIFGKMESDQGECEREDEAEDEPREMIYDEFGEEENELEDEQGEEDEENEEDVEDMEDEDEEEEEEEESGEEEVEEMEQQRMDDIADEVDFWADEKNN